MDEIVVSGEMDMLVWSGFSVTTDWAVVVELPVGFSDCLAMVSGSEDDCGRSGVRFIRKRQTEITVTMTMADTIRSGK